MPTIRLAIDSDISAITRIANQSIATTTASMHWDPLADEQQLNWLRKRDTRHVVLVAEQSEMIVGWAALGPWEVRAGYRDTSEVSVYVDQQYHGHGLGRKLLEALIEKSREHGLHCLVARIADGQPASLRLHLSQGFELIGTMREVGYKFGQFVDVHILQRISTDDQPQAIGYFCGKFVPECSMRLRLDDLGVTQGIVITEKMRTFGGEIHLLDEHLRRLELGLQAIGLDLEIDLNELAAAACHVVDHNYRISSGRDLGVSLFVTPGSPDTRFTCSITTCPLPMKEFAKYYRHGISLVTIETREIPDACVPKYIKHRNRLHYYLAEREAQKINSEARALLLDTDGFVAEGTTAAIIAYSPDEGLVAPPPNKVLRSVSWEFTARLAEQANLKMKRCEILPDELDSAEEIIWCSTPMCLYAVTNLNGQAIGNGSPGKMFHRLMQLWSQSVEIDIVEEANRSAARMAK